MLLTDRTEFDAQMQVLCAGFNVPMGERSAAYWRGLAKMELRTFVRVVEHCLGEKGPERIPTVNAVWTLSKSLRPPRITPEPTTAPWQGDQWDRVANLRLIDHIRSNGSRFSPDSGYDSNLHQATAGPITREFTSYLVQAKNAWAEDVRSESNPTSEWLQRTWREGMASVDARIEAWWGARPSSTRLDSRARSR